MAPNSRIKRLNAWKYMKDRKNNKPADSQPDVLLRDQIELRAYHIWLAGGGGHGNDLQHWLQAEMEIVARPSAEIADSLTRSDNERRTSKQNKQHEHLFT